jgi:hypothetical protein
MKNVLKLIRGFRGAGVHEEPVPLAAGGNSILLDLPKIGPLLPDLAFIVAKASATASGNISHAQAESEIMVHCAETADAYLKKLAEIPMGWQKSKANELSDMKKDLGRLEKELANGTKRSEVDVVSDKPQSLAERIELTVTSTAAIALSFWSIYSTHSFLEGSGILSGLPAWGVSIGPIMMANVLKDALTTVDGDHKRRFLRLSYIGLTAVASIVWISTFGHEAGAPLADLNNLNAQVSQQPGNSVWLTVRGISQLIVELFGGAILFHKSFELWKKKGDGQDHKTVLKESPQFIAAEKERNTLRIREQELETHLGQIQQWLDSHSPFKEQYVTKAKGELTHNINLLKGA